MSAYKFQAFIIIDLDSLNLPKVLYDMIEINKLNLIKIFLIFNGIIFIG